MGYYGNARPRIAVVAPGFLLRDVPTGWDPRNIEVGWSVSMALAWNVVLVQWGGSRALDNDMNCPKQQF